MLVWNKAITSGGRDGLQCHKPSAFCTEAPKRCRRNGFQKYTNKLDSYSMKEDLSRGQDLEVITTELKIRQTALTWLQSQHKVLLGICQCRAAVKSLWFCSPPQQ